MMKDYNNTDTKYWGGAQAPPPPHFRRTCIELVA